MSHYNRLFVSQFGSKLKGIKTQAFQKLNRKLSKLKDFVPSKLNFSENLSSLDARNEFLCNKNKLIWEETQQNIKIQEKIPKLKEILA